MNVKAHHLAASLFAGAIFLSSLAWFSVYTPSAIATCSGGANIGISNPPAGTILSGNYNLVANSPATPAPNGVTFAISAPTTQVIGQGSPITPTSTSYSSWGYSWNTTGTPDGNYSLSAIAHYSGGSAYDCISSPVAISIHNANAATSSPTPAPPPSTQSPKLSVAISPNSWQGGFGQKMNFTVSGTYTNEFGTQYPVSTSSGSQVVWDTNTGTIATNGQTTTTLSAGNTAGNFVLGANVTMNGLTSRALAALKVFAPSTTSTSPAPVSSNSPSPTPLRSEGPSPSSSPSSSNLSSDFSSPPPLSQQEITRFETTPTVFRPSAPTNSRPIVAAINLSCLEKKLGARYMTISSGSGDASADERIKGSTCFSGTDRIPATLAPVEPTRISEVATTSSIVTIGETKNETIINKKGDKISAILIGGTAAPNSDVYVYIFSDPMVLRAQTDKSGKWSYVLQNPLKPGHHEIYAVAAKDSNTFVRTSAVPVSIAAAASGSQDGSLVIESRWKPAQVAYVGGALLMIIVAMFLLFRIRRSAHPVASANVDMVHPGAGPVAELIHPVVAGVMPTPPVEATTVSAPASAPGAVVPTVSNNQTTPPQAPETHQ